MNDLRATRRRFDRLSLALLLPVLIGTGLAWGGEGALAALAGGALMWADVQVLAFVVELAALGGLSRSALLFAVLPAKYVGLIALVYGAITRLGLDGLSFVLGVSAIVSALLVAAVLHAAREGEGA